MFSTVTDLLEEQTYFHLMSRSRDDEVLFFSLESSRQLEERLTESSYGKVFHRGDREESTV